MSSPELNDDQKNIQDIKYLLSVLGKRKASSNFTTPNSQRESHFNNLLMMVEKTALITDCNLSETTQAQQEVESDVKEIYENLLHHGIMDEPLARNKHLKYIEKALLDPLPHFFKSLDASHPWMLYWLINSNLILDDPIPDDIKELVTQKLKTCIHPEGGFGGGKGQLAHAAATFAATLTLCLIEDYETLSEVRESVYSWLMKIKNTDGSFSMHIGGERDTRSTYCVLIAASLLNIMTPELLANTPEWIGSCQTYEGGFSGIPNSEAHGGYTFCAVASLCILGEPKDVLNRYCDLDSLIRWSVLRQYQLEGGFSGRSNKLVDACYSHWVGCIFPFLEMATGCKSLFNRASLQTYLLNCCQASKSGGFRDKPGKSQDFYHTNYSLTGLSASQHFFTFNESRNNMLKRMMPIDSAAYSIDTFDIDDDKVITIGKDDLLCKTNPLFGLPVGCAEKCKLFLVNQESTI